MTSVILSRVACHYVYHYMACITKTRSNPSSTHYLKSHNIDQGKVALHVLKDRMDAWPITVKSVFFFALRVLI